VAIVTNLHSKNKAAAQTSGVAKGFPFDTRTSEANWIDRNETFRDGASMVTRDLSDDAGRRIDEKQKRRSTDRPFRFLIRWLETNEFIAAAILR